MITVTIPPQEFSAKKYQGTGCDCYLEEALKKEGYKNVFVFAVGRAMIDGKRYVPREPFGYNILKNAFRNGESVTVNLVRN